MEGLCKLRFAEHINLSYTHSTNSLERAHAFIMGLKRIAGEKAGVLKESSDSNACLYIVLYDLQYIH